MFKRNLGLYIIIVLVVLPVLLWAPTSQWDSPTLILKSLGQVTALVGTVLFCISFTLSARFWWVEKIMSGLNRAYLYHHLVGVWAFVLLLVHPTLTLLSYWSISLSVAFGVIAPSAQNLPVMLGMFALDVMVLLMVLTLFVKLKYETWKATHQWLGASLLLGAAHALTVGSTIGRVFPLKVYMALMLAVGFASFCIRLFLKYTKRRSKLYEVVAVRQLADVVDVELKALVDPIRFTPGQFAFISVEQLGISSEQHPFSLVTYPDESTIHFGIKSLGDYTETLRLLKPGAKVRVEGGYGAFSAGYLTQSRQVWIAGGIGITPFLSMLSALPAQFTGSIWLYYCTKDAAEAVFWDRVQELCARNPSLHVVPCNFTSTDRGRLTMAEVLKDVDNLRGTHVYVCGPPAMMSSVKAQCRAAGMRESSIHTEEFSIR